MSNHRFLLLMALLVALLGMIFMATVLVERRQAVTVEEHPNPSVYNSKPSGYRGWLKTLEKAGLPVIVWRSDFGQLTARQRGAATLVMIQPDIQVPARGQTVENPLDGKTVDRLIRWIQAGNSVVLLDGFQSWSTRQFLDRVDLENVSKTEKKTFYPVALPDGAPKGLGRFVSRPLVTGNRERLSDGSKGPSKRAWIPLLIDAQGRPVLQKTRLGSGNLILGTVPDLASNRYLLDEGNDNLQFLTNLLRLEGKPILVNEFIHGYHSEGDLFQYYMNTPLSHVVYQLFFLFIVILWLSFLPWRPVRRDPEAEEPVAMKDFVTSMAAIYQKARAAPLAVGPQLQVIRQTLRRRYRMELPEIPAEEAEKSPAGFQALEHLLGNLFPDNRIRQQNIRSLQKAGDVIARQLRLPPEETVRLVQALMSIQERLEHGERR